MFTLSNENDYFEIFLFIAFPTTLDSIQAISAWPSSLTSSQLPGNSLGEQQQIP